ncbi:MAG: hypothetical protein ACOXZ7_08910 [Sphaerochaeta sp.]
MINGNVLNTGLIPNLPNGCCVEVPCLVDGNGVQPTYVGALPGAIGGVQQGEPQHANPDRGGSAEERTRAICIRAPCWIRVHIPQVRFDRIDALVDELLVSHGSMIPYFD